jgi:hypothetical protein
MSKHLWLKIVNNRYRVNENVRDRVQSVLAALMPEDIVTTTVVIEADALPCQAYVYRTEDLYRLRLGQISVFEIETLSPMVEAPPKPSDYEAIKIYQREKEIWVFTLKPRFIGFFGSASGKFKYNLSAVASQEGYLLEEVFYKIQGSYSALGSTAGMRGVDKLNPSQMLVVRSDSVKYFQANSLHLEQAYLQKSWNMGKGTFFRVASGFFETAMQGGLQSFYIILQGKCLLSAWRQLLFGKDTTMVLVFFIRSQSMMGRRSLIINLRAFSIFWTFTTISSLYV